MKLFLILLTVWSTLCGAWEDQQLVELEKTLLPTLESPFLQKDLNESQISENLGKTSNIIVQKFSD